MYSLLIKLEIMIDPEVQKNLRQKYNPDGSVLRQIQLRELEILKAIDKICRKHNIKYWLSSGTLLGAVRHGGFIPWDDDVDIEMMKKDYIRFKKIANTELIDMGFILHTHDVDKEYMLPYGKVVDFNTIVEENAPHTRHIKYKGLWVDVFIMEPSSSLFIAKCARFIQWRIIIKEAMIKNRFLRSIVREMYHCIFYKILFPIVSFVMSKLSCNQLRHSLGSGFLSIRKFKDVKNLDEIEFEGYKFFAPSCWDNYLRGLYGDYSSLPKDNGQRKTHSLSVIFG